MSNQTDISQLTRKYLNGELDARAMHSFEREAQGDPFVMDALDGYTKAGANQQANLAEIGTRLNKFIRPSGTGWFNWKFLSIVTPVAILLTAGVYLIGDQSEKKEQKLVQKEKTNIVQPAPEVSNVNRDTVSETTIIESAPVVVQQSPVNAAAVPGSNIVSVKKTPVPVKGAIAPAITGQQNPADSTSLEELIAMNYKPVAQGQKIAPLSAETDGAGNVSTEKDVTVAGNVIKTNSSASEAKTTNMVSGRIMDAAGPIPGALVTVKGTSIKTVTDLNGRFTLPATYKKSTLDVSMNGYTSKQVKVNQKDSLFIDMKPKQAINGVITGYGTGAPCCWDVYEKYLKDNAISPDGKTGTVKLSFVVNPDNSLTGFTINKGLSEQTDQKAIELIKNGPVWLHDSSGKPTKVSLRIKFEAKQ